MSKFIYTLEFETDNDESTSKILYEINKIMKEKFPEYIKDSSKVTLSLIDKNDLSLEDLDFTVGTYHNLKRAGINTLNELKNLSYEQLSSVRNISSKRISEIQEKLKSLNYDQLSSNILKIDGDKSPDHILKITLKGESNNQ